MEIKGQIITVICVCAIGGAVVMIAPEGDGGGIVKHVRLAVGIITVVCCISPVMSIIGSVSALDPQMLFPERDEGADMLESIFEESLRDAEEESLKDGIADMLNTRFGIGADRCKIDVVIRDEGGERRLERIFITLYGSAIWKDTGEIEKYFSELFGCEVITAIG